MGATFDEDPEVAAPRATAPLRDRGHLGDGLRSEGHRGEARRLRWPSGEGTTEEGVGRHEMRGGHPRWVMIGLALLGIATSLRLPSCRGSARGFSRRPISEPRGRRYLR